TKRPLS
ncbi:periplasmic oligopeptide-binding protein, partial [Vibrio parahaemolyticus V-223/04]